MKNDHLALIAFVLEKSAAEPPLKRAAIYRGLAGICGEEREQQRLLDLASIFTTAEASFRESNSVLISNTQLNP